MKLSYGLDTNYVNPVEWVVFVIICYCCVSEHFFSLRVTQKAVAGVYQGITTIELDVS